MVWSCSSLLLFLQGAGGLAFSFALLYLAVVVLCCCFNITCTRSDYCTSVGAGVVVLCCCFSSPGCLPEVLTVGAVVVLCCCFYHELLSAVQELFRDYRVVVLCCCFYHPVYLVQLNYSPVVVLCCCFLASQCCCGWRSGKLFSCSSLLLFLHLCFPLGLLFKCFRSAALPCCVRTPGASCCSALCGRVLHRRFRSLEPVYARI